MQLKPGRRLVVFATLFAACSGEPSAPPAGRLTVSIGGLPGGVSAAVSVTGPNGFARAIDASDALTSLTPGNYTVAATPVSGKGFRFDASPATQTVVVEDDAESAATVTYAPVTARLTVEVSGLPQGATASIQISGPGGSTQTVTAKTTLELLTPGEYEIAAAEVLAAGLTFRSLPTRRTVTLQAGATQTIDVAYASGVGSLEISIAGLPDGVAADVSVTGPNGFSTSLTDSETLSDLAPGEYTVIAATVGSNLTTHAPSVTSQLRTVTASTTSAVSVTYGSAPLRLGVRVVAEGLIEPVFLTAPSGDARLFIVERNGRIRIVENGLLRPVPFLDITHRVNFVGERGMLGLAFDPAFGSNGLFYVYYVDLNGDMVVERYGAAPASNVATPTGTVVINIPHKGSEHHGGTIAFGPDGMMYIGPGDGGCCGDPRNNGQNLNSLLGKILRIDVRSLPYSIPRDNPFLDRADARPEIWAYGLRNPWRYSFDAADGMLYIGDVGDDTREEVNVVPVERSGVNFGWRLMEGSACFTPRAGCNVDGSLTLPLVEYLHSQGCSVTGGYVYRGRAIPELTGHYLYSDYCRGWLRSFRVAEGGIAAEQRSWDGVTITRSLSFGQDGAGELYLIGANRVYRIVRE